MKDPRWYLAQLRHAFKNAIDKTIGNQEEYGKHLLGPAIKGAELAYDDLARVNEEVAALRIRLADYDKDNVRERNALKEQVGDLKEQLEKIDELCKHNARGWNECEKTRIQEGLRLKMIEISARKHYDVIKGTMAAQSATGLALKEALEND